jgi:hypothetical protein
MYISSLAPRAMASYSCISFNVPMTINSSGFAPAFPPINNSFESVQLLNNITDRNGVSQLAGAVNLTADVSIATQYCAPNGNNGSIVQFLTHSIGFDHSYWDFGGENSSYNCVKAATEAGYATLSYDRLGTGNSTKADPYTILQRDPEVDILTQLTSMLHNGQLSQYAANASIPVPDTTLHIGHSFGSVVTAIFAGSNPSLTSGIILTGLSTNGTWQPESSISLNPPSPRRTILSVLGT